MPGDKQVVCFDGFYAISDSQTFSNNINLVCNENGKHFCELYILV